MLETPYTALPIDRIVDEEIALELELDEYQELLRTTTRSFLEDRCSITATRALADDPAGFDPAVWRAGADLGWTSFLVSEADGGGSVSGDGLADLVIVAEELGRLVAPGPLLATNVAASALGGWADDERRRATLGELVAGATVATWAHADRAGSTPARLIADGETYRLDGAKAPVEAGGQASTFVVTADSDEGPALVVVPADAEGVSVSAMGGLDLVRRFAEVRFDEVAVAGTDLVVGPGAEAAAEVERLEALAVVIQCAETVGALERIFAVTVEMLGDRYSFGRPLSSYQALKHRCADMATWIEGCAATATEAARALSAGRPDAADLAGVAKAWIGPVATEIVQDCVQLHGGIGVTWDHDLHLYLRRVTVNRATWGTPDDHLERVAAGLLDAAEPVGVGS